MDDRLPLLELNREQLKALVSPIRGALVGAFGAFGPASVAEIANILDLPVKSIYYQVRILMSLGLLRQVGTRGEGRKEEALIDSVASRLKVLPSDDPEIRSLASQGVVTRFGLASKEY